MKVDFVVRYDQETETESDLAKKIIRNVIVRNRLQQDKQTIIFMSGDSGEGKSLTSLALQKTILEPQGINFKEVLEDVNVFVPIEYPKKIDRLLFSKELKKVNTLCIHEAREIIKAKMWTSFLTQAIADVNAMSRAIKPLCFIIVSQFIRDITTDVRYTLNYYCKVYRPPRRRARLSIWVMWKDDRDLEKPKLRKRRLRGYIVSPNGKYRAIRPSYFELQKPEKEVRDRFKELDFNSKRDIIRNKLDRLIKEMEVELNVGNNKIIAMVNYYSKNFDTLRYIGKRNSKGEWKIRKEVMDMHDITPVELKEFEKGLNEKLKTKKIIEVNDDEGQDE